MEHDPLIDTMYGEFLRRIERMGYVHDTAEGGTTNFYKVGRLVGVWAGGSLLEQAPEQYDSIACDYAAIHCLLNDLLEMYSLFRRTPPLSVCDDFDTRILCEFNGVVLAAKVVEGGMALSSCQYRYDRTGVRDQVDYGGDYAAAKMMFSVWAGLVPPECAAIANPT